MILVRFDTFHRFRFTIMYIYILYYYIIYNIHKFYPGEKSDEDLGGHSKVATSFGLRAGKTRYSVPLKGGTITL